METKELQMTPQEAYESLPLHKRVLVQFGPVHFKDGRYLFFCKECRGLNLDIHRGVEERQRLDCAACVQGKVAQAKSFLCA